jgi:hypothetical protein
MTDPMKMTPEQEARLAALGRELCAVSDEDFAIEELVASAMPSLEELEAQAAALDPAVDEADVRLALDELRRDPEVDQTLLDEMEARLKGGADPVAAAPGGLLQPSPGLDTPSVAGGFFASFVPSFATPFDTKAQTLSAGDDELSVARYLEETGNFVLEFSSVVLPAGTRVELPGVQRFAELQAGAFDNTEARLVLSKEESALLAGFADDVTIYPADGPSRPKRLLPRPGTSN